MCPFSRYSVVLSLAAIYSRSLAYYSRLPRSTLSHSVIMRYLHLAEEYPPAQLTQNRRAVLIVPCHLFDCRFFVE